MLLIDHRQAEGGKADIGLNERVRADHDLDLPGC